MTGIGVSNYHQVTVNGIVQNHGNAVPVSLAQTPDIISKQSADEQLARIQDEVNNKKVAMKKLDDEARQLEAEVRSKTKPETYLTKKQQEIRVLDQEIRNLNKDLARIKLPKAIATKTTELDMLYHKPFKAKSVEYLKSQIGDYKKLIRKISTGNTNFTARELKLLFASVGRSLKDSSKFPLTPTQILEAVKLNYARTISTIRTKNSISKLNLEHAAILNPVTASPAPVATSTPAPAAPVVASHTTAAPVPEAVVPATPAPTPAAPAPAETGTPVTPAAPAPAATSTTTSAAGDTVPKAEHDAVQTELKTTKEKLTEALKNIETKVKEGIKDLKLSELPPKAWWLTAGTAVVIGLAAFFGGRATAKNPDAQAPTEAA